jgi:uncharacterized protein (TIGR03435 family)
MGRPVVDRAGIPGEFDFEIRFTEDQGALATDSSGPDFLTAMREQLGLTLQSQRGPVEVLVIEHAERLSAN